MRNIRDIHDAIDNPIDDLITYRAMPTSRLDHIDPFLFLNHHGPQEYPPDNNGLPFGPHPHRGFETLTFIFKGDLVHWDSGGGKSTIREGGIQWMTAGSGIVHAEISSDEFRRKGGNVEIVQLWLNLPSYLKMTPPTYTGLQKEEIPAIAADDGKVIISAVAGIWKDMKGPVDSISDITIAFISIGHGGTWQTEIPTENNILCYVVNGEITVNGKRVQKYQLVEFENNAETLSIQSGEDSLLILGHGKPFHEPIVAQGPFVMNSMGEIKQAWLDYQRGKMGSTNRFLP